jgi:hypothetical protein
VVKRLGVEANPEVIKALVADAVRKRPKKGDKS